MAPWAVAAHFKDFKVIDNPIFEHLWQDMPMILGGCCLGEGFIDFDVIMKAICEKAKRKREHDPHGRARVYPAGAAL